MTAVYSTTLLVANTQTVVFTGTTGYDTTVNVVFCNQGVGASNVQLAYISGSSVGSVAPANIFLYNEAIQPNTRLEFKGIAMPQNTSIVAFSTLSSVSVLVHGFEEAGS